MAPSPEVVPIPKSYRFSPVIITHYHPFDAASRWDPRSVTQRPVVAMRASEGERLKSKRRVHWAEDVDAAMSRAASAPYVSTSGVAPVVVEMRRTGSRGSLYGGGSMTNLYEGGGGGHLSRSSSRLSNVGGSSLARSASFSPGYVHRSTSSTSVFGRSLRSASAYTPPFHSVALQRSTPHYMDKYPYVRYSYGGHESPGFGILQASSYARPSHTPSSRDSSMTRYMTPAALRSSRESYVSRYAPSTAAKAPTRSYYGGSSGRMDLDGAVDMYKNRCMTMGTLSKYWLGGRASYSTRREREAANNYVSAKMPGTYRYYLPPRY